MSMKDVKELSSQDPDADGDVEQTGLIILNYNKLMAFRANGAESNILHAPFAMLLSLGALKPLLIFLVTLLSDQRDQILELLYQYVKVVIIIEHKSKMLRKFSTKKSWPRDNSSVLHNQSNIV